MSLAENIKILREKTGAGLMDCKKALQEKGNSCMIFTDSEPA